MTIQAVDQDYIHCGYFSTRRHINLRQAELLDGRVMAHDQMGVACASLQRHVSGVGRRKKVG